MRCPGYWSRRPPWLWLFWLLVVNVAVLLFLAGRADLWSGAQRPCPVGSLWSPLWLNLAVLAVWEGLAAWRNVARLTTALRRGADRDCGDGLRPGLGLPFHGRRLAGQDWAPVFYAGWAVALSLYYRHFRRDLVPLALVAGSLVIVGSAGFGRQIFVVQRFDVSGFLLLGAIVAGLSAAATVCLRHTARRWQAHAEKSGQRRSDGWSKGRGEGEARA